MALTLTDAQIAEIRRLRNAGVGSSYVALKSSAAWQNFF